MRLGLWVRLGKQGAPGLTGVLGPGWGRRDDGGRKK